MNTQQAAAYMDVTRRTLYGSISDGMLPAYRFGRVIRLRRADVDAFIERCRIEPGALAGE